MRKAGILMPISALPSPYGIGTMGKAAREFADFLAAGGQSCWQLLPVGPTSYGDSPYQSFSSFAGNPYFIDLDILAQEGWLRPEEFQALDWGDDPARVDYGKLYVTRYPVLRKAVARLLAAPPADYAGFLSTNAAWLEDYALFMALKDAHGGKPWREWDEPLRRREPEALARAREDCRKDVEFWQGVQYLFYRQWFSLKDYANERGIAIIGDLPIYVPLDSADVWTAPEQFQLDRALTPIEVAGCPPDAFTADGQLWGNPLFDWEWMGREDYAWWMRRIGAQFRLFDVLRIDHFRGFDEYYAIPYGDTTARNGRWRPGPGIGFFRAMTRQLGEKEIIAEDLGFVTDSVRALLRDSGFPGMKVLEFAFDSRDGDNSFLPHHYSPNSVVYTGTHDNETIQGWFANASEEDAALAKAYLRLTEAEGYHWGMMRVAWASPSDLAVMQFQDLLGLGNEARMNTPSTLGTNWQWRALPGAYNEALAQRLFQEMRIYQRLPQG